MTPAPGYASPRVVAAVLAGTAIALGSWVAYGGSVPGEQRLLARIHGAGGESIDRALSVTSRLTDLVPLGVVAVGVLAALLASQRRADAAFFVAAVVVVWAVNPLLKEIVGRARPDLWPLPESISEHSFPSGHAANTAALAGGLVLILRRRRLATVVGVGVLLVVGLSQLVLGRHYPSDIIAGWLWAAAWIFLLASLKRGRCRQ